MNILIDEDLPRAVADVLRSRNYDAIHVVNAGLGGATDKTVFEEAQKRGALLISADMGFANVITYPPGSHAGIVVLRFPDYFRREDILNLLRRFLDDMDLETLAGGLAVVTPGAYKIRRQA